ncbi:hypothetical protein BLOT_015019 [Blomia tropicalis]|nr:hypothetical protein BLOT_015019 [Blomia tropicalis]
MFVSGTIVLPIHHSIDSFPFVVDYDLWKSFRLRLLELVPKNPKSCELALHNYQADHTLFIIKKLVEQCHLLLKLTIEKKNIYEEAIVHNWTKFNQNKKIQN